MMSGISVGMPPVEVGPTDVVEGCTIMLVGMICEVYVSVPIGWIVSGRTEGVEAGVMLAGALAVLGMADVIGAMLSVDADSETLWGITFVPEASDAGTEVYPDRMEVGDVTDDSAPVPVVV